MKPFISPWCGSSNHLQLLSLCRSLPFSALKRTRFKISLWLKEARFACPLYGQNDRTSFVCCSCQVSETRRFCFRTCIPAHQFPAKIYISDCCEKHETKRLSGLISDWDLGVVECVLSWHCNKDKTHSLCEDVHFIVTPSPLITSLVYLNCLRAFSVTKTFPSLPRKQMAQQWIQCNRVLKGL